MEWPSYCTLLPIAVQFSIELTKRHESGGGRSVLLGSAAGAGYQAVVSNFIFSITIKLLVIDHLL